MICPACSHDLGEPAVPEWFDILTEVAVKAKAVLPPFDHADAWRDSRGVSETLAEDTALALKAKWGGKSWKYKDPYATWQSWCRMGVQRRNGSRLEQKAGLY